MLLARCLFFFADVTIGEEGGDIDAVERGDDGVSGCWLLVSSSI